MVKAVEGYRPSSVAILRRVDSPSRCARNKAAGNSGRSWTAPALWRFGNGRVRKTGATWSSATSRVGEKR